jgi:hypothetical protein
MHSKKTLGIAWTPGPERPRIIPLRPRAGGSSWRRLFGHPKSSPHAKEVHRAVETPVGDSAYRLPRYDSQTRRFEFAVFAGLGLTALALMGPALLESCRFAENRDVITEALTSGQPDSTELACCPTNHGATNVTVVPAAAHRERAS